MFWFHSSLHLIPRYCKGRCKMSIARWRISQWVYVVMIVKIPGIYTKCCETGTIIHPSGNVEWITDTTYTCECSSILVGGVSSFINKPHGYIAASLSFISSSRDQGVYKHLCHPIVNIVPKSTFRTHTTTLPILSNMVSMSSATSDSSSNRMEVLYHRHIEKSFRCITPPVRTFPHLGTTMSSLIDIDVLSSQSDKDLYTTSNYFASTEPTTKSFSEDTISKAPNNVLTPTFRSSSAGSTDPMLTHTSQREISEIVDTTKTPVAASASINYHGGSSQALLSTADVVDVKTTHNSLSITSTYTPSKSMESKPVLGTSASLDNKGTTSISQKTTTVRNDITAQQEDMAVTTASPFISTTLAKSFLTTTMSTITTKKKLQASSEED